MVYQTDAFVDGVYANFEEFATQTPSLKDLIVEMNGDKIKSIKTNAAAKAQKINIKNTYAVVVDNTPYYVFEKEYIPLIRENNELTLKVDRDISFLYVFGIVGALLPQDVIEENITYMIDHLTGNVLLKEKKLTSYRKSILSKKRWGVKEKTEYQ